MSQTLTLSKDAAAAARQVNKPVGKPEGKREQTKRANRLAILEAAKEVFTQLGYGETTVRHIIRRTGLASGTFYNYFKSKEEVFEALADESALQIRPALRDARVHARSFEEFVEGSFRTFFTFAVHDQEYFDVVRRNSGAMRVRMDTPEIVRGFDELETDLADAIKSGLIPPLDLDFLTASMIGIAFEVSDRMVQRALVDVENAVQFATHMYLGGVKALIAEREAKQDSA